VTLALWIAGSFAAFLVAAKLHGRALRLEREAEGITSVDFRGKNPPFVEQLWRAERSRFWPMAAGLAALALALGHLLELAPRRLVFVAAFLWAPTVAFLITGAMSARRRATRARP
jgi:hypothetical protein